MMEFFQEYRPIIGNILYMLILLIGAIIIIRRNKD